MDRNTPLYDTRLSVRERAEWLVSRMTVEEKCACFGLRIRNDRLGFAGSLCGGEGAHGVQARAGQWEQYPPTPTTSFPQPIGLADQIPVEGRRHADGLREGGGRGGRIGFSLPRPGLDAVRAFPADGGSADSQPGIHEPGAETVAFLFKGHL